MLEFAMYSEMPPEKCSDRPFHDPHQSLAHIGPEKQAEIIERLKPSAMKLRWRAGLGRGKNSSTADDNVLEAFTRFLEGKRRFYVEPGEGIRPVKYILQGSIDDPKLWVKNHNP